MHDTTRSARDRELSHDTNCIVVEGATLGRDTMALRCDTAQQRTTIQRREARDMMQELRNVRGYDDTAHMARPARRPSRPATWS